MVSPPGLQPDAAPGDYPGIGFDPAHGNASLVGEFARQFLDTAECAGRAHEALNSVLRGRQDVWFGEAAEAFAEQLDDLPRYIDNARESLEQAGKALDAWSDQLGAHQRRAVEIEGDIQNLLRRFEHANEYVERTRQHWNANPADQAAAGAHDSALKSANDIAARIEELRRIARDDLMEAWRDDGRRCAEALNDAGAIAPDVGRFERLGDAFRDAIGTIGDIAGIVSAVAGLLACIPVLAPVMGPIALVAGGVALAANATDMALNGNLDDPMAWVGLGGDALGMVPGVGAAFRGARGVYRTADVATDGAQAMTRGLEAAGRLPTNGVATTSSGMRGAVDAVADSALPGGRFDVATSALAVPASVAGASDHEGVSNAGTVSGTILSGIGAAR
ncbi:hypothetical protein SAMN06265360_11154 [Haloechinothrix alba]|uniref:Putative T7SS secretion signal domain-containing protein n=1 Tax=Haloechinothrix alba TaxID=664784 RepID=A0A238XJP9_9PSEU|nr:hypothetical protein [Haloechinothrix alba]SNR58940.1 hypothetical protein SAMN06265360_11154 [Haloechinothrix alba]